MQASRHGSKPDTGKTGLLTWLSEAAVRFGEPVWKRLTDSLEQGEREGPKWRSREQRADLTPLPAIRTDGDPRPWFRRDPGRISLEQGVLAQIMTPVPGCPSLLHLSEDGRRLGAVGLVELGGGAKVRLAVEFGDEYPRAAAQAFLPSTVTPAFASLLRQDGSIPVPVDSAEWTSSLNAGFIVVWATEWLEEVAAVYPQSGLRG